MKSTTSAKNRMTRRLPSSTPRTTSLNLSYPRRRSRRLCSHLKRSAKPRLHVMQMTSRLTPSLRPQILLLSNNLAQAAGKKTEVLVRAVKTRWNTVTHVISRAIELEDLIPSLCDMNQFNKPRGKGLRLRALIPTDDEWTILKQLHELLLVRSVPLLLGNLANWLASCLSPAFPVCHTSNVAEHARARP